MRIILGRSAAYFLLYYALACVLTLLFPRLFGLPHIGHVGDVMRLLVPYLLSTIFFAMCVSVFVRNRESGMVLFISTSLIFLFLAGISWPRQMMPQSWVYLSHAIPYTWGANAFIHIQSMGANLLTTRTEYDALWILTAVYCCAACLLLFLTGRYHDKAATQGAAARTGKED